MHSKNRIQYTELDSDLKRFERRLQLHLTFHKGDSTSTESQAVERVVLAKPLFEQNPSWWPKKLNATITNFCYKLKSVLNKLCKKTTLNSNTNPNVKCRTFNNITYTELKALKELHYCKDVVIKRADKNSGIVVMNSNDYFAKVTTMLNDANVYQKLSADDTPAVKLQADNYISLLKTFGYINNKQHKNLTNYTAKCPKFYGMPKLHKKDHPLRPIVSSMDGPTYKLNNYVHELLMVAESEIPNLFKDTTAYLNCIEQHKFVQPNTLLVTLDVVSLYTNIPHLEATDLICEYYVETLPCWSKYNRPIKQIPVEELRKLLLFILTNCTFQFNDEYFKQKYGIPMGAPASVRVANIYMYKLLLKFFKSHTGPIPPFIGRLVDDIFTMWIHGLQELLNLVDKLNSFHQTIKFELTYSDSEVHFLDTTTYIDNGVVKTKLYIKPTDKKQYLHFSSAHPAHVKKSIPFSQALRYRRITCDDDILQHELTDLKQKFLSRGYPSSLVEEQLEKVKELNRADTLIYKSREQKQAEFAKFTKGGPFLPLIITFCPNYVLQNNNIATSVHTLWKEMCQSDSKLNTVFGGFLPQIVYKRGRTTATDLISASYPAPWCRDPDTDENVEILAQLLTDNDAVENTDIVSRCGHKRCMCCSALMTGNSFRCSVTHNTYKFTQHANCNSCNIVYLITCAKCHKQYIGETGRSLKDRLNNHRSTVKTKQQTAVALHFNDVGHSFKDLKITIIDVFSSDSDPSQRKQSEHFWIRELHTGYPTGLNYYPLLK